MLTRATLRSILVTIACGVSASVYAMAGSPHKVDVPAGELSDALLTLAEQSGAEFMYSAEQVRGVHTGGVHGEFTPERAVIELLQGTPLQLTIHESGAMLISRPPTAVRTSYSDEDPAAGRAKRSFWSRLLQPNPDQAGGGGETSGPGRERLQEVVVTAQKTEERLQDVPAAVTAIAGESLTSTNQLRLQDYYTSVPGLSLVSGFGEASNVAIRGLTTGGSTTSTSNPTVAVVIDDVPFGSSTFWGGGDQIPDIDPSEVAQVEVLRGPQGVLYGANSLGGLIKYVTIDPSTQGFSGRLEVGAQHVRNGDDPGYVMRGSLNAPLSETFAIRGSGFWREYAGYINNPGLGLDGVNQSKSRGGRLSALWQPSDTVSLRLSASRQKTDEDGRTFETLALGRYEQQAARGTGSYEKDIGAYSATLKAKFGGVELTALSGYNRNVLSGYDDFPDFGFFSNLFFNVDGAALGNHIRANKFSQEVRLAGSATDRIHWLAGVFYTNEDSKFPQNVVAIDSQTGVVAGESLDVNVVTNYREYAGFGSLTFDLTDRLDVQVGGRYSKNKQEFTQTWGGPYATFAFNVDPFLPPKAQPEDTAFTYLVTPRFKVSPDFMVYARLASGYRPGGASSNPTLGVLPNFEPDTTLNYELGMKGSLLEDTLSYDVSVYRIDWKDIQLQAARNGLPIYVNGNDAKSQGVELSLQASPFSGFRIGGWLAWNDAELTEALPTGAVVTGRGGDRLPQSARFSGHLSVDQEFLVGSDLTAFLGASASYIGVRKGPFTTTSDRQIMPSYTKTDLRAGFRYNAWTLNAYVDNLTNARGFLSGGVGNINSANIIYIQPRIMGVNLSRTF